MLNISYQNRLLVNKVFGFLLLLVVCIFAGKMTAALPTSMKALMLFASFMLLLLGIVQTELALFIIILSMLLSPEISVGSVPGRDVVIRVEDLMIMVLGLVWIAKMAVYKELRLISKTPLNKYIAVYTCVFIFTTGRGMITGYVSPLMGTFFVLKYIEYFVLFYLVVNTIHSKKQIKNFLIAFLITFVIVNIYAMLQMGETGRTTAPFEGEGGEPNTLGGYMVLLLAVILALYLYLDSFIWRISLLGCACLMVIPFMNTLSRASYMAILPMLLALTFFTRKRRHVMLTIISLSLILGAFFLPGKVYERIKYTFTPIESTVVAPYEVFGIKLGPSSSARVRAWVHGYYKWRGSPFFGYGVTGMGFIDSQYMRSLTEMGLLGICAFLYLLHGIFKHTKNIYRQTEDKMLKGLALGFLAGHIAIMFHAVTANTFVIVRIMEPYWFLAAMVMVIPRLEKKEEKKPEIKEQRTFDVPYADFSFGT